MELIIQVKNKFKISTLYLSVVFVITIFCNVLFFSYDRGTILNDTCVSVFKIQEFNNEFSTIATSKLVMKSDKSGYVAFSGNASYEGKSMILSRDIRFKYEKESNDIYRIFDYETVKYSSDNTPDTLMDSVFFSTRSQKPRYIIVSKIMNAYVIGNLYSPIFMCVVK